MQLLTIMYGVQYRPLNITCFCLSPFDPAGEVCVVVFRAIAGLPITSIWTIAMPKLTETDPLQILMGASLGLVGAFVAFIFSRLHYKVMDAFRWLDLMRDERAVYRGLLGGTVILALGMAIPHTMFWGEMEFQTIASLSPASTLPHVWPTSGLFDFEMKTAASCLLVGVAKLVAISFTVAGGYRGGFIFPFFATGAALGRAITFVSFDCVYCRNCDTPIFLCR